MGRLAASESRISENLSHWTLPFPIEISGFEIIKIILMNLQDSLQTGAAKTAPTSGIQFA